MQTTNRDMKHPGQDSCNRAMRHSHNGNQVNCDECRVDQQRDDAIKSRELPTPNDEAAVCFEAIVMTRPVRHPRASRDRKKYSLPLLTHGIYFVAFGTTLHGGDVAPLLYLRSRKVNANSGAQTIKFQRLHV